ncbi:UNVERIFIED_CONTAM: hypothetical protein GTU68_031749 [Idotea baltica]|nr:hypothetical protein [Idotea baltica]
MTARKEDEYRRGNEVIVRSDRGVEVGQVLCEATDDALSNLDQPPSGAIVRMVSQEDATNINSIDADRFHKIEICKREIKALSLDMKLVDVETLLGRERIIVFYVADERVDFRQLVKVLASEFKTRIEMRQVGVRDEAKLLADYGDCGKPVCCNNHLVTMPPVSMKMAKLQKATLDPTKISGRCGRLKCCLRYEFDTYEEIQKQLPRVGTQIITANGRARVLNQQIIAEQLLIEMEDHRRMVIDASEVLSVIKSQANSNKRKKSSANENIAAKADSSAANKSSKQENSPTKGRQRRRNASDNQARNKKKRTPKSE